MYKTNGFLEKNRDNLSRDVGKMLTLSRDELISALFRAERTARGSFVVLKNSGVYLFFLSRLLNAAPTKRATPSVTASFSESLTELVAKLTASEPQFIRCIKPNPKQSAGVWVDDVVARQLKYAGVLETVRIRRVCAKVLLIFAYVEAWILRSCVVL